jgi:hypothetical protein
MMTAGPVVQRAFLAVANDPASGAFLTTRRRKHEKETLKWINQVRRYRGEGPLPPAG